MTTSVIPAVIDALVEQLADALPNVSVYDGYGVSNNPGDFLMVGVDDPDAQDSASSTDSSQEAATLGTSRSRDERGDITCVALAWDGNTDQKAVRDRAFAITAAVENLCRSTPNLGITAGSLLVTSFGSSQRLMQNQDEDGVQAVVVFTVAFRARL